MDIVRWLGQKRSLPNNTAHMKGIKALLVLGLIAIVGLVHGQASFQRSIGGAGNDFGRAIVVCSDGGYMIAGATNSFINPSSDVYVLRIDDAGDYVWGRNFGSENHIEWAVDLIEDADGNFLLAGYTDNTNGNGYDGLLMKVDGAGNHIWTMNFGGSDWDFFEAIALDEFGNIYLGGSTYAENGRNAWLLKLDASGNVLWEDTIPALPSGEISDIHLCDDGNFVFTGNTEDPLSGEKRVIGGRFDRDGEFFWTSVFEDFGDAEGISCTCTDGQLKLIGNSYEAFGPSTADILILGFDLLDGSFQWIELITNNQDDRGMGIGYKENGNLIVCGARSGFGSGIQVAYISEFGPEGNFLGPGFGFTLGGTQYDLLYDLKSTADGGYVVVGETNSFGNNYQVYVIKVDSENNAPPSNIDFLDVATNTKIHALGAIDPYIYPNPASEFIHINLTQNQIGQIRIISSTGQDVFAVNVAGSDKINLPSIPAGIYTVEISLGEITLLEKLVIFPR
jgi:hypothetical protein